MNQQGLPQATYYRQVFLVAATWGTAFAFIKVADHEGITPLGIAAARGGLTAVVFALWLLATRKPLSTDRLTLRHAAILGLSNGLVPNVLIALAMRQIESAPAAIIQASVPAIVAVIGHFVLRGDRLDLRQWIGIAVGFIGVLIVIDPLVVLRSNSTIMGSVAMLGAALSYASSTIYLRIAKPADPYSTAFGQQIVSAVAAFALMAVCAPQQSWDYPPSVWLALVGLAIVATAVPTILYFKLVSQVAATKAALVQYLLPIATGFYSVVLLKEGLRWGVVVGGAVVLVGVWLATRSRLPTRNGLAREAVTTVEGS